jgi:branched-chain amino acid transport system ATP-binding protein
MSALLSLDGVEVKYGNIIALKKVSLSVDEGEIVCLIGANGAGKSTLLKAVVGLEPLTAGTIALEGQAIARVGGDQGPRVAVSTNNIIARGISLVPEGRRVFSDMTVQENLEMGAFLVRDDARVRRKMQDMFDLFPILGQRRKQKTGSLSGGEQQMMAIARSLMSSPRLLLLDEPGLGLAPLIIRDIFEVISSINREEGVTVFLVEQNARIALNVSKKGYVMETGSIVLEDTSTNLLTNDKVRQAYLGE